MDLSVIIVNYNTTEHLKNCLNSIYRYTKRINFEVIVVDNNSSDKAIKKFPNEFSETTFIFNKSNCGFGEGCNVGSAVASGKYLAFVNPDIKFESDCLSDMFNFMENKSDAGACSPLLKDFEGNLTYIYNNFPDFTWEFHEAFGFGNEKKSKDLLKVFDDDRKINSSVEVDWLTGACLILRKELFEKISGYDNDYFLYYEDTDLQFRISSMGYKIYCVSDREVKHFTNSSIKSDFGEDIYFFQIHRSKLIYFYKNSGFTKRNIIRLFHITGIIMRILILPLRNKFKYKRRKKLSQYIRMLKLYLSGYEGILESNLNESE